MLDTRCLDIVSRYWRNRGWFSSISRQEGDVIGRGMACHAHSENKDKCEELVIRTDYRVPRCKKRVTRTEN